jgi:CBS domain containing-hemolysin-like protein
MDYLLWIFITVILSAFFSGMEIAFVSSNKLRIEIDKKKGYVISSFLSVFTKHPSHYIATMLIGNNVALVVYGLAMAKLLEPQLELYFASDGTILLIKTLLSTIIILIFSEFLPKTIFRVNPNNLLRAFAFPVMFFYVFFYPITKIATGISAFLLKIFFGIKSKNSHNDKAFDRFDLNDLIGEQTEEDQIQQDLEKDVKIFRNVLDFSNIKLKECIVPRNEIVAVEVNESIETVIKKFNETGFSRLLIYEETIDNIIGYVHTIDMFKKPGSIKNIVHTLPIAPEAMPANKLLASFTAKNKSIALVVDEFGGTAGIVTLEDIIEEIFGEIEDEHDKTDLKEKQLSASHYILSGRHEIDYLNEKFNLHFPVDESYETLAGFILSHTEDIPDVNKIINIGQYRFQITKASGSRIEEVDLRIMED